MSKKLEKIQEVKNQGEIILYQAEDGNTRIKVKLQDETVWLTQKQMGELFDCSVDNIALHLKNIYNEGELEQKATSEEFSVVQMEGDREVKRSLMFYNLDAIISVGYRISSMRATQFRRWATGRLKEYIVKGFTMDDERLANAKETDYFEELLTRIRAIRSSEKRFYQKITDIYATSVDYDTKSQTTKEFFKIVQNELLFAITGNTAAEIIYERVDKNKPYMGLLNFKEPRTLAKTDIEVAKNYLSEDEIRKLNRIVDQYLSFAETQAENRKAMTMADWKIKLDDFIKLNDMSILQNAGSVSHEKAIKKAENEYIEYKQRADTEYENDFDREVVSKYLKGKK